MRKVLIATLILTASSFMIPSRAQAQANTLGYGIDVKGGTLDSLKVRSKIPCRVFALTTDSTRVPRPGCTPGAREFGTDTLIVGNRYEYVLVSDCLRDSATCKVPFPDSVRIAFALFEGGKAGIFVDKENPGRLHVNFRRFDYRCEGESVQTDADALDKPLANIAGTHPIRCGSTAAALDAYHYALDLENNERETFTTSFWYATGLTIPLRYWPGYDGPTRVDGSANSVGARATGALNGSVMIGFRGGWTDYKFVRHGERRPEPVVHVGFGPFVGLTLLNVDENTSTQAVPPDTTSAVLRDGSTVALSAGAGLLLTVRDFTVGLFVGIDHGFGQLGDNWDFQNRLWFGVGITTDQLAKVLGVK